MGGIPVMGKQSNPTRFRIEEIRQNSRSLFGVYPEVIDGAITGLEKRERYSLAEVQQAIEQFKQKEAK